MNSAITVVTLFEVFVSSVLLPCLDDNLTTNTYNFSQLPRLQSRCAMLDLPTTSVSKEQFASVSLAKFHFVDDECKKQDELGFPHASHSWSLSLEFSPR